MARKRTDLVYSPDRQPYTKKTDAFIKARVQTAESIMGLQQDLESEQALNTESMDHFISLYRQNTDLGIPEDKRFVSFDSRSAKAPDIIHRVMGMLMTPLRPHYIQPYNSVPAENKAAVIEKHLSGAYSHLRQKTGQPFDLQSLFWQLLVGKGFIQQTYLPNYWDKTVRRRRPDEALGDDDDDFIRGRKNGSYNARIDGMKGYMGPPFHIEALDPRIVFPLMTPRGPEAWLKKYVVQRFEAEKAFEDAGAPVRIKTDHNGAVSEIIRKRPGLELPESEMTGASSNVTYYEYIDDQMVYYVVGNEVAHSYNHGGGIIISPAYGLPTGFKEWELCAVSLLYAVRNEIPQFDFLRTLWANRAYIDVFPQLFAELDAGMDPLRDSEGNPEKWEIEPMTIKQIRGRITNAFKDAQAGVDYRALIDEVSADIDLATIAGLARGVGGAQQPGYAINQLTQSMRTIWKPIVESRENQWAVLYENYLKTVKYRVKEEVTAFTELTTDSGHKSGEYLSIEPTDIEDFFQVRAELKPDLPIDTQGNMLTWAKMGTEGWATDEEVSREGFNKPNWKERRRQIDRDVMRRQMRPAAIEDAIILGRIKVQQQVAQSAGLDKLNAPFRQNLENMRATSGLPGGGQTPADPTMDPAGAQQENRNGASLGTGNGIAAVAGASQPSQTPAARG